MSSSTFFSPVVLFSSDILGGPGIHPLVEAGSLGCETVTSGGEDVRLVFALEILEETMGKEIPRTP